MLLFRSSLSSGGGEANYDNFGANIGGHFLAPNKVEIPPAVAVAPDPTNFNGPATIGEYVTSCPGLFSWLPNFNYPVNIPSNTLNLHGMFNGASSFNQPIKLPISEYANIPNVPLNLLTDDLDNMFMNSAFNQPINNFPPYFTGESMFQDSAFNSPIDFSNSNAFSLERMFYNCQEFNQPVEICSVIWQYEWTNLEMMGHDDTSLNEMFAGCSNFNSPVTFNEDANISGALYFYRTFADSAFNCPIDFSKAGVNSHGQPGLQPYWFEETFYNTPFNQSITFPYLAVGRYGSADEIVFINAFGDNFNQPIQIDGDNGSWFHVEDRFVPWNFNQSVNISSNILTSDMSNSFYRLQDFNAPINLPTFICGPLEDSNDSDITGFTTYCMFYDCKNFNQPLNFNFSELDITDSTINIDMTSTLWNCLNFNQPVTFDVNNLPWNMSGEVTMSAFFSNCSNFNQPIEIPRGVTDTAAMFFNCRSFNQEYIKLPDRVTDCKSMFEECNHIDFIDVYKHDYDIGVPFNCKFFVSYMSNKRRCLINISGDSDAVIQEYYQHFTTQPIVNLYVAPQWTEGSIGGVNWGCYNTYYNIYIVYNLNKYNEWNSLR